MCALVCIILGREFGCGKEFGRNILPPVEPLEGNPQNLRGDPLEKKSAAHFAHTSTTTLQVQVHQRSKARANCLGLEEEDVVEVVFGCNFWVVDLVAFSITPVSELRPRSEGTIRTAEGQAGPCVHWCASF